MNYPKLVTAFYISIWKGMVNNKLDLIVSVNAQT